MHTTLSGKTLHPIAKGDLCAGCGACAGVFPGRIKMEMVSPGFLRPQQSAFLSADEEDAFVRFCPALGQRVEAQGRANHVLWGPYQEMCTGWATDPEIRFVGASGGALSGLLLHLLESGEVDAVVQVSADPENPIANRTVISTDRAGLLAAAGSRYAPSAPLTRLTELVETGWRYAFVGKPCDVVALRVLTEERPNVAAAFPVLLSFFCAGVPSETGGRAVLTALGAKPEAVTHFRYRGRGWPGRATANLIDGSERSMSYQDSWGGILSNHIQHRCKICADGTGKAADLVCGDAWECDDEGYPVFDEADGVSLIVSRTQRGERVLKDAVAAGRIETADFNVANLASIQPGQRERRRALLARLVALKLASKPIPSYTGLKLWAAAIQNKPSKNIRNFLGMLKRLALKRFDNGERGKP